MVRLIGIDGDKGSGKDTLAEVLIRQFKFTRLPFALPMKVMLCEVFELHMDTFEDRKIKDSPFSQPVVLTSWHIKRILDYLELSGIKVTDDMIKQALLKAGTVFVSPRHMMQYVGTELVRDIIGKDVWVTLWCREQAKYDRVIAPDARMPNERDAITVRSGKNVLIKRPGLINSDSHLSENNHGNESDYDAVITNSISKQELQSEFAMWYTVIKDK